MSCESDYILTTFQTQTDQQHKNIMIQSTFRCISLIAPSSNVLRRSFGVLPQFAGLGPLPASRMHSTKPARVPRNTMELFNMLDLDRNGVLDKTEFYSATAKLNMSEEVRGCKEQSVELGMS